MDRAHSPMFNSQDNKHLTAISTLSAAAAASASRSPISPTSSLGGGLPLSDPPRPDYMGDEICFALPSLQEFEIWRSRVERHLVVDFVHGDKHSSRSTPKAFLEHVKMVCARHSRSGRKPYDKKYPERQRKVPSRKVPGGCPATISYRTFVDKAEVHVSYIPQHSHVIGTENYEHTRQGRREAAAARSKSRSPRIMPMNDFGEDIRAHSEAPPMMPDTFSYSHGLATPLTAPTPSRPLPSVSTSPGLFPRHDGLHYSPVSGTPAVSPTQPSLGLSASPMRALDMRSLPYSPVSANVSPVRTAQSLPTPINGTHALPHSTPTHAMHALPHSTPALSIHALPMSTPVHHSHTLPNTPAYTTQPLTSPVTTTSPGLPPQAMPMHNSPSPMHSTHHLPQSAYSTPLLNISTQLPPYDPSDPFSILGTMQHSDSSEQDYGPLSAGPSLSVSSENGQSLAVPGNETISLTITSSPSPHPATLGPEALYPYDGGALPPQAEMQDDSHLLQDLMDLRAERWTRMQRMFEAVQSQSDQVQYSEDAVHQLDCVLHRLWTEADGMRNASTESLGQFLSGGQ